LGSPFTLEVNLTSVSLKAEDLRGLSTLSDTLHRKVTEEFLHYPDLQAVTHCSNWLGAWLSRKRGVSLDIHLHSKTECMAWHLSNLSGETFGYLGGDQSITDPPEVDLSMSMPSGVRSYLMFPHPRQHRDRYCVSFGTCGCGSHGSVDGDQCSLV
jgi:hypothetical protein